MVFRPLCSVKLLPSDSLPRQARPSQARNLAKGLTIFRFRWRNFWTLRQVAETLRASSSHFRITKQADPPTPFIRPGAEWPSERKGEEKRLGRKALSKGFFGPYGKLWGLRQRANPASRRPQRGEAIKKGESPPIRVKLDWEAFLGYSVSLVCLFFLSCLSFLAGNSLIIG